MTITWADLDRDRWAWAVSARAELRAGLAGLADPDDVAGVAHVMLVGDTHSGKTTVLLALLGVSDEHAGHAADVLRAGRGAGLSATAAPIRYCWSGHRDQWLLIEGKEQKDRTPRWLSDGELKDRLACYRSRSGEQVIWNVADPPLEIGIPDAMARSGITRPALRILDMPGLWAADDQEKRIARDLVRRAAPSMSLIVIVQAAHHMAAAMQEPAIAGNPHLACWHSDPARFRIVLTQAFSADSSRKLLVSEFGAAGWDPRAVTARLRSHVTEQLAQSAGVTAGQHGLEKIVFPVEVGDTREDMDPEYAANALPASDLMLAELRETLEDGASEDGLHLSAPILGRHIMSAVRQERERRQRRLDRLAGKYAAAQALATEKERDLERQKDAHDRVAREAAGIRADAATLEASRPVIRRPAKPEMKGPAVRDSQEQDRLALLRAASDLWDTWRAPGVSRSFPATLPANFERELRARYDQVVGCCQECSNVPPARWRHGRPDHCYAKMTTAMEQMQSWISTALGAHVEQAVSKAARDLDQARAVRNHARRVLATYRQELSAAATAYEQAQRKAEREEQDEEKDLRIARQVLAVHNRHNKAYVRELARRTQTATPDERGFLAVAALRAIYDLGLMHGRA